MAIPSAGAFPFSSRVRPASASSTLLESWYHGGRRVLLLYLGLGLMLYLRASGSSSSRATTTAAQVQPKLVNYVCKDVLFVRHAEGVHNRDEAIYPDFHSSGRSTWPDYYDAPLTDLGRRQAKEFALPVNAFAKPELLVTSPLSRAIDTALLAFPQHHQDAVLASDLCRERISKYTSDVRKSRTELKKLYPQVDFSQLNTDLDIDFETKKETVPHEYDSDACKLRAQRFVSWLLLNRPEKNIAVVTHWVFLQHLLRAEGIVSDSKNKQQTNNPDAAAVGDADKLGNAQGRLITLCRQV